MKRSQGYKIKMGIAKKKKIEKRLRIETLNHARRLNSKELIDWINEKEYFEYEEIEDLKKVIFSKTKLKGHVAI